MNHNRKPGTLWKTCQPGIMAVHLSQKEYDGVFRHNFEEVSVLDRDQIVLYLGDTNFYGSQLDLYHSDLLTEINTDQTYSEEYVKHNWYAAAQFLVDEKKVYIFYNDYYNLWDEELFFKIVI